MREYLYHNSVSDLCSLLELLDEVSSYGGVDKVSSRGIDVRSNHKR